MIFQQVVLVAHIRGQVINPVAYIRGQVIPNSLKIPSLLFFADLNDVVDLIVSILPVFS